MSFKIGFSSQFLTVISSIAFFKGNTQLIPPSPLSMLAMLGINAEPIYMAVPDSFDFDTIRIVTESPNVSPSEISVFSGSMDSTTSWFNMSSTQGFKVDLDVNRDLYVQPDAANDLAPGYYQNNALVISVSTADMLAKIAQPIAFTPAQQTAFNALSAEQQAVISALTNEQKVTMLSGTATQKNALLITLTPAQQSAFTSTPVQFIETSEQVASDKLRMEQIVNKLKNNQFIDDDDSVFYTLNNSLMATAAMAEIDAGRGFDGLRTIGLTQPQALKVLSIYNVTIDKSKYESEVALSKLLASPDLLSDMKAFLAARSLALPPLTDYLASIRSDHAVYDAIKSWNPQV